jgi:hypothetical protein
MDTGFPATARHLATHFADAAIDEASFERPLARCDLRVCGGTCCAHGASLNAEEALVVRQLTRKHEARLREWVPDLPAEPVVVVEGASRTAVKPRAMHGRVPGYPAHFPDTACAYLDDDARCALQRLAEHEGRHPWAYKPLACWLHPISLTPERVALPDAHTDPHPGGFASATHCGRTARGGLPAREVLSAELEHLALVLGGGRSSAD